jgi:hypothetical protein
MVSSVHLQLGFTNNYTYRTSATNGARVYNTCLSRPENQPDSWQFGFDLRTEQVWDGFCLLSLLEDHAQHQSVLTVPNDGPQKDRFTTAMKARNLRIQQAGQNEYAHACNKCVRVWDPADGKPCREYLFCPFPPTLVKPSHMQRNAASLSLTALPLAIPAAAFSIVPYLFPTTNIVTAPNMMAITIFVPLRAAPNLLPPALQQVIQRG